MALRWALASSLQEVVTLTAMLLPDAPMAGFRRLLRHPHARCLCRLPGNAVLGQHHAAWTGRAPAARHIPESLQLVIVANDLGLNEFYDDARATILAACMAGKGLHVPNMPKLVDLLQATRAPLGNNLRLPRHFMAAASYAVPLLSPVQVRAATADPSMVTPSPAPLLMADRHLIYTDGSKKDSAVTAACYRPGLQDNEDTRWAAICKGHPAHLNTALRGELAALHHAVHHMALPHEDIVIMTDSLTAIQLIHRMMERPEDLKHHMHKQILQEIVPRLLARQGHTTLCKVRAHIGVQGNEKADQLSRAAHTTTLGGSFTAATRAGTGPNWVLFEHHGPAGTMETEASGKSPQRPSKSSADTTHASVAEHPGQEVCKPQQSGQHHQRRPAPKSQQPLLGSQRPPGQEETTHDEGQAGACSHPVQEKVPGIQPRGHDTVQALCHSRDTQGHRLGGCIHPLIHARVTARHGKAVHLLAEATRRGHMGDSVLYMDAEGYERYPEQGAARKRLLPRWVLPLCRQTSKPDMVVLPGVQHAQVTDRQVHKRAYRQQHSVHLVEVGYTGDYSVHDRVQTKLTQHDDMRAKLLAHGWKEVHLHAFVISHTGMLPTNNMAVLQALQVDDTNRLLHAVHLHSVNTCHSILNSYESELRKMQPSAMPDGELPQQEQPAPATARQEQPTGKRRRFMSPGSAQRPQLEVVTLTPTLTTPQHATPDLGQASAQPPYPQIRTAWHPS